MNEPLISRRQLLEMSGMGLGSVALAAMLHREGLHGSEGPARERKAQPLDLTPKPTHFPPAAKAVIQLVMTGGPSQMDMFDPKPTLQRRHGERYKIQIDQFQSGSEPNKLLGSPFSFKKYGECGMDMCELLPHFSTMADDVCLVRSMVSVHNNHTEAIVNLACAKMFIGRPTLGAWVSYALGTENENLPGFVVLRDPTGYSTSGALMSRPGWLPALYGGTHFNTGEGPPVENLKPASDLPEGLRPRALDFLAKLNEAHRKNHPENSELETRIRNYELAARMQLSASDALDASKETEATKRLYGLDKAHTRSFGTRCLMARRLVEAGVRFVQVFSAKGQTWDHHTDVKGGLIIECGYADPVMTGLLKDLKQRGLLDSTIVVWAGEFGRMPVAQSGDGRDHNKHAGCLWLAGGGFRRGYIHGATDHVGYTAVEKPFSMPDMFACILHQLGLDHREVGYTNAGRWENVTDDVVTDAHLHPEIIETPIHI